MVDPIARWCEQQRTFYVHRLDKLQSGKLRQGEIVDGEMVDMTQEEIEHAKSKLAELDALLRVHKEGCTTQGASDGE
jgi:hypothetical protein